MERTRREESLSFKEKMGRLLADARAGKRQLEYRDIFRYFRPKELKEEELDRVLDILAENQVQILDEGEEQDAGESEPVSEEKTGQADPVCLYLKEIGKISLLTPEEELMLAKEVRAGSREAKEKLARANLRLVVSIAKHYAGRGKSGVYKRDPRYYGWRLHCRFCADDGCRAGGFKHCPGNGICTYHVL